MDYLALWNIGIMSIHKLRNGQSKRPFPITLVKEFLHDHVDPSTRNLTGLGGIAQISAFNGNFEHCVAVFVDIHVVERSSLAFGFKLRQKLKVL